MMDFTFIASTFHRFYKPNFEVLLTANICVDPFLKSNLTGFNIIKWEMQAIENMLNLFNHIKMPTHMS